MTNNQKLQLAAGVCAAALASWWYLHSGSTVEYKTEVAQHNGIRKFVVKDLSRIVPGRIGVFMKAKGSTYPLVSFDQPPVRVTVELNDTALPSGGTPGRDQCGEVAFGLPPLRPSCSFAGTNLICK